MFLCEFSSLALQEAGATEPTITAEDNPELKCKKLLPSVDFGSINASRVIRDVPGFEPTPLRDAVRAMVAFFRVAWDRYPAEREEALGGAFIIVEPLCTPLFVC